MTGNPSLVPKMATQMIREEIKKWIEELDVYARLLMELKRLLENTISQLENQEIDHGNVLKEINVLSSKTTSLLANSAFVLAYMEDVLNKIRGNE